MAFETELNKMYQKIARTVSDAIPVDWKEFYFQGEIKAGEGGVFFFFNTFESDEYKYCYYIPDIYNVDRSVYNEYEDQIFDLTVELQEIFIKNDQEQWFSVTLIVDEERKLKVHYDYINWSKTEFGPTARLNYFQYKYLNKLPNDQKEKEIFEKMNEYEQNKHS
ncbi:DUF600 family protein [Virgibacillus dakarensis]|nr:DUF600 family protein [Virgibacillus dakarensis]